MAKEPRIVFGIEAGRLSVEFFNFSDGDMLKYSGALTAKLTTDDHRKELLGRIEALEHPVDIVVELPEDNITQCVRSNPRGQFPEGPAKPQIAA